MRFARNCLAVLAFTAFAPALSGAAADTPQDFQTTQGRPDASDPCRLELAPAPVIRYRGALSRGYDGDSNRHHAERASIKIEHAGDTCAYILRVEPDGGPGSATLHSGGDSLVFSVDHVGRPNGRGDNVVELNGSILRGQRQKQAGFEVSIPSGQSVRAGQYVGRLVIYLYEDQGGARDLVSQRVVEVAVDVEPKVVASLGSDPHAGTKSMTMDFGTLVRGQTKTLDFSVDANTLYSVGLMSQNGGELRHEFTSAGIPYEVRVDGDTVQPTEASETTVLSNSSDAQHNMQIMITGNTNSALAGNYSDRLTIVIKAD